jgi:phosphoribosyl 1,2-cyclic phosphate phosphodiesterase
MIKMKFKILGSGGAISTPRAFCKCSTCAIARKDDKYKRNSSCAYYEEEKVLFDCPEDINDSLNRFNISEVRRLFITHWHPDHTFGLRVLLETQYNFYEKKAENVIEIYVGKKVFETLIAKYPSLDYLVNVKKVAKINFIEDGDIIKLGHSEIKCIGYNGKDSEWYAFVINNKIGYAPCDTINFKNYRLLGKLKALVHECPILAPEVKHEIHFPELMERIKTILPERTFLTHFEEIEIKRWGIKELEKIKTDNPELNLHLIQDGQEIEV